MAKRTLNKKGIKELINVVEGVRPSEFDLNAWLEEDDWSGSCKTRGCVAGHWIVAPESDDEKAERAKTLGLCVVKTMDGRKTTYECSALRDADYTITKAAKYFGISESAAGMIFGGELGWGTGARQKAAVLNALRTLVEHGEDVMLEQHRRVEA